jgi:hypothetical protein
VKPLLKVIMVILICALIRMLAYAALALALAACLYGLYRLARRCAA